MKKDILENVGVGSNNTNNTNKSLACNDGTIVKSNNDSNESLSSNDDGGTIGTKSNNDVIIAIGILIYYKLNPQKKSVEVNTKIEEPVYRRML